jgi:hypothetical protein
MGGPDSVALAELFTGHVENLARAAASTLGMDP